MVLQGEPGEHGAGRAPTVWSVSVSREHKRPMVAFLVVAVACTVLVVNAARSSAVDLLRGPLPALAATNVWHLVPGVEHAGRPAEPAPLPIAGPIGRPAAPTTAVGEGRPERTSEAPRVAHRSTPDRARERERPGTRDGAHHPKRGRGHDGTYATRQGHPPESRSTTASHGAEADHGRHQRADDRSTGWAWSRGEKAHDGGRHTRDGDQHAHGGERHRHGARSR